MIDITEASNLWNESGYTQGMLAVHFGVTRNAIAGLINRNRDKFKNRNVPQCLIDATEKRNEGIKNRKGRANVARNETLPIKMPVDTPQTANQRRSAFYAIAMRKEEETAHGLNTAKMTSSNSAVEYDKRRIDKAKVLIDLNPCDCRWPLTDNTPHLFCSAISVQGYAYCDHHRIRAKGLGTISERSAARDLKKMAGRG